MLTFQDYEKFSGDKATFIRRAINEHMADPMTITAVMANRYDKQLNDTILNYTKYIYTVDQRKVVDTTASNNKLASNFFRRLNVQRNTYLLGNGATFGDESTKDKLGKNFDQTLKRAGYNALIHGVTFGYWNLDKLYNFTLPEFKPLWDEYTSELRAGIRYWRIDANKPLTAVFYEEDGYTKFIEDSNGTLVEGEKNPYVQMVTKSEVDGEQIVGEFQYSSLPIVPFWGSSNHQSTLVGLRAKIDAYDLISSGFANDLNDCAQIYWLLNNANGMDEQDLQEFRDRLNLNHIAKVDRDGQVVPYTQDIPSTSRKEFLDMIRAAMYEDFGGLDVHTIAAGATNDHIDAGYQALDEEADDYEYQCAEFINGILALQGIEDEPTFKRNRISNEREQTDMILSAAEYLDTETILSKLPFITVEEIEEIMKKKELESASRFEQKQETPPENPENNEIPGETE